MKQIVVDAKRDKLDEVLAFLTGILEEHDCPPKIQMQLEIAVEELFVNIASYAYGDGTGDAVINVSFPEERLVRIVFIDEGFPYDPLAKEDPDITLSAQERQIGGLGIYMVKKSMDYMSYEYKDGKNMLTIEKRLQS